MWTKIRQFLASPTFAGDEDRTRTAALLNPLILSVFGVVILAALATVFVFAQKLGSGIVVGVMFLALLVAKLLLQGGQVRPAGMVFIAGVWLPVSAVMVLAAGHHLIATTYVALTVIAGLIIGRRAALNLAVISSLVYLGIAIADAVGIVLPVLFPDRLMSNWVVLSLALALTVVPLNLALRSLNAALESARRYAAEAEQQRRQVEALAEQRALDLNRRAGYLGAATEIAAEIAAAERNLQELLRRTTEVISRQFGFYHVAVFLLDDNKQWAVLQAASSEGGQRMLQQNLRLRVGAEGIIGAVAAYGQYRLARDVDADVYFLRNPNLPETRSELALPLRARGEVIGVLDVQHTVPDAFADEDVYVLQTLADQISVAISNARLLRRAEESIAAERRAYGRVARQAWRELLRARPDLAFASDERGVVPFPDWEPQMKTAVQTGQAVGAGDDLAIPIRVRDQVIGVIDGRKSDGTPWKPHEIDLLQTLTEQLSTALEGAQLYEDTQRRAAREQLAREITAEMRRSLDVTTVLQTALHQLRSSLGLTEAEVWIEESSSEPTPLSSSPDGSKGGM
ncbi:MAG: GAF domain-containing protein [Anaerolineae bacterium]